MDQGTKRNFLIFLVSVVIAGMVFSYLPILQQPVPSPVASVLPPPVPENPATSTRTQPTTQGFNGLEEEGERVNDLKDLLNDN